MNSFRFVSLTFTYLFLLLVSSCKNDPAHTADSGVQILQQRDSLSNIVDRHINLNPDTDKSIPAADMWHTAEAIAKATPGDTVSAATIFKTAVFLKSRKEYTKAIATWGLVVGNYQQSRYAPVALFQQAVTFDNELRDKENAKRYYDKFIKLFPSHDLAAQVKNLQTLSGKSDEEIIKSFQKKNK